MQGVPVLILLGSLHVAVEHGAAAVLVDAAALLEFVVAAVEPLLVEPAAGAKVVDAVDSDASAVEGELADVQDRQVSFDSC